MTSVQPAATYHMPMALKDG